VQSAVEKLSPTSVRLTVEVPFEDLKPNLDAAYKKVAQQVSIPGFRKGKVPPQIIDQRIGRAAVLDEAVNEAVPELYYKAIEEAEVTPLGQPEIEVTEFEDREKLTFTAEVDVKPAITLPEYSGLQVEVDDVTVTDDDVNEQILALRERFGTLVEVDRPASDGDFVTIDLSASKDGELIEDAQATGLSYQVGKANMLDGLDEALQGMSAGESKTFITKLVGGDQVGEDVDVEVKVSEVKEQELPELDEEFAQTASEFDTVEELTDDVRARLERGKRLEQASEARDAVLEKLLDITEVPVPEKVLAQEIEGRREQIREQLQQINMTLPAYLDSQEQTEDEFEADLEKRARDAMASQFVLDEIARAQEIGVDEGELSEHIMRRAQQSGMQPEQFAQQVMQAGQVPMLVSEVVRGKALASVVEAAEVKDASGNPVDLKNLQPDGSIGEPAPEGEVSDKEAAGAQASEEQASEDAAAEQPTSEETADKG
jgi:trigger factor